MYEFRKAASREEIRDVYSFRSAIFRHALRALRALRASSGPDFDGRDEYDGKKQTSHYIAVKQNRIFAHVRLIRGTGTNGAFHLPMERYFDLSLFRDQGLTPVEFSQLLVSDDPDDPGALVKFILFVLNDARRRSENFLCALANTQTDDPASARIIYRIAQIRKLIHPDMQTPPRAENQNPGRAFSPLYSRGLIRNMEQTGKSAISRITGREKKRRELPVSLEFFARLGFRMTSIPAYLSRYGMYSVPMLLELDKARIRDFNKDRIHHAAQTGLPAKEINCRTANSIIRYVKEKERDIKQLLKGIPFSEEYLTDENNWLDCGTIIKLFKNARLLLKDPDTAYKVGYSSGQLKSIGIVNVIYKLFSNPLFTFKMFYKFIRLWNRVQTFKILVIAPNRIEVIMSKPPLLPTRDICEYNRGLCAAVPSLWNLKTGAEEINCVRRGDPYCKFRVSWEAHRPLLPRIYYSTVDRILTLIESRMVLRQKRAQLESRINALEEKSRENIRLNRMLDRSNLNLQEIIDKKIHDLEKACNKQINRAQVTFKKEKTDILENLTGLMAHEIKNNMYSVDLLYDKCLQENLTGRNTELCARLEKTVQKIPDGTAKSAAKERLSRLVQNYTDIDFTIKNSSPILKKSIDLCRFILKSYYKQESEKTGVSGLLRQFYEKNRDSCLADGIRLTIRIRDLKGARFNSHDILTIAGNLLNNSREALARRSDKKIKKIRIRAEVKNPDRNPYLFMEVEDNGPGIPAHCRDRVFEPFFSSSAQKPGLGLTFCRKIARRRRGEISFKTGPERTVFCVILPVNDNG